MTINVLHILHNLEVAGAQTVVKDLVLHADPRRVRPVVCAWKRGGPLLSDLRQAGVPTYVPGSVPVTGNLWKILRFLESLVRRHGVGLVHGHMSDGAFWGGLLSRRAGVPFVLSHYSNHLLSTKIDRRSMRGRLRFWMLKRGAHRADLNVACAPSVKQRLMEDLRLPERSVQVILNGIPVPPGGAVEVAREKRAVAGAGAGSRGSPFTVVTVGRHDDIKGQDQLVRAAPLLLQRCPGARIVLVGEGPRTEAWRALARELGVEGAVSFSGYVEKAAPFLEAADVYVAPSHFEGISLALLEAMAWCLPAVASDVPGNRDTVVDGVTGVLYPLNDVGKLVEAISGLRGDPPRARRLAESGRRAVQESFSIERMAGEYEAIYHRLAGSPAGDREARGVVL